MAKLATSPAINRRTFLAARIRYNTPRTPMLMSMLPRWRVKALNACNLSGFPRLPAKSIVKFRRDFVEFAPELASSAKSGPNPARLGQTRPHLAEGTPELAKFEQFDRYCTNVGQVRRTMWSKKDTGLNWPSSPNNGPNPARSAKFADVWPKARHGLPSFLAETAPELATFAERWSREHTRIGKARQNMVQILPEPAKLAQFWPKAHKSWPILSSGARMRCHEGDQGPRVSALRLGATSAAS